MAGFYGMYLSPRNYLFLAADVTETMWNKMVPFKANRIAMSEETKPQLQGQDSNTLNNITTLLNREVCHSEEYIWDFKCDYQDCYYLNSILNSITS